LSFLFQQDITATMVSPFAGPLVAAQQGNIATANGLIATQVATAVTHVP
jgi:hypothetical protein